ncbi:MAG: hypothetical protein EP343_19575 [Deltaproteobacteria bacterium]|nr:MAG: hypothetical protein EP343_19575 [Deltaproteobacteria bacterium]
MTTIPTTLRVMTWNIWFDSLAREARMREVLTYVEEILPEVIGFQELTQESAEQFNAPNSILSTTYRRPPNEAAEFQGYWEQLYTTLPVGPRSRRTPYEWSYMGRGLSVLHCPQLDLVVGATHLESMDSAEFRQAQAREAFERLDSYQTGTAIFMGDTNLYDDETLEPLPTGWVDAWTTLYPNDPGWTRDSEVNKMLRYPSQQRIDRIFIRSQNYKLVQMEILGLTPLDPDVYDLDPEQPIYPSDHFGLLLEIKHKADAP